MMATVHSTAGRRWHTCEWKLVFKWIPVVTRKAPGSADLRQAAHPPHVVTFTQCDSVRIHVGERVFQHPLCL